MDERVLNLELLAYNFHESLNLKPHFLYLERQIEASGDSRRKDYLNRLYKVASEISRKQMLMLESAGQKFDRDIFRGSEAESRRNAPWGATLALEGVQRQFLIFVLDADLETSQIKVRLEIKTQKNGGAGTESSAAEIWVGYFDFPMIDNTRLTQDQRAVVVLNAFEDGVAASITLAYFPGSYASLKDKVSPQEVSQNLMRTDEILPQKP